MSAPAGPPPAHSVFAGTSGWAYPSWKPGFYPRDVPAKKFLASYASRLTTVEVNYTFASRLKPGQLEGWLADTPPHFRFSFKASQNITHRKRLRDCAELLASFLESLQSARTAGRLGLVLFQLPPNFKADPARLAEFLSLPPLAAPESPRTAFEFRHPSWFTDETWNVLGARNAALCIAESDDLRTPEVHTAAGFTCFRLRRNGGYGPRALADFARQFQALAKDRDVFAYFKHEDAPTGALNAADLLGKLAS